MLKNKSKKPFKDQIIDTALELAQTQLWQDVTCEHIIEAAQADPAEFYEYFEDKGDILSAYDRRLNRQVFEAVGEADASLSERERLFDLLMERFDVLNENREAMLSILDSVKTDPKQAVVSFPHLAHAMSRILAHAGVETDGLRGAAKVVGLAGVYLYAVKAWRDDESADMAKTMAALDKALDTAEGAANSFCNGGEGGFSFLSGGLQDLYGRFRPSKEPEDL